MFRTITAKFPGTCARCKEGFAAGEPVRYNGRACWHLKANCPGVDPSLEPGSRTQGGFPPTTAAPSGSPSWLSQLPEAILDAPAHAPVPASAPSPSGSTLRTQGGDF